MENERKVYPQNPFPFSIFYELFHILLYKCYQGSCTVLANPLQQYVGILFTNSFVLSKDPCYVAFHDEEWGVPVYDDKYVPVTIALIFVYTFFYVSFRFECNTKFHTKKLLHLMFAETLAENCLNYSAYQLLQPNLLGQSFLIAGICSGKN